MKGTILIVDDNREIVDSLGKLLAIEGYEILTAYDGMEALSVLEKSQPDLILLDVMMPRLNGLSALMKIRESHNIPAIMLSAKTEESDKVSGLLLGADDYITKPFETKELVARVKAVLRRAPEADAAPSASDQPDDTLRFPELTVSLARYEVTYQGRQVEMPPKELEVLYYLASHPNMVFTREQLLERVWGFDFFGDSRTVDVHIKRLREKLPGCEQYGWEIHTVWRVGYKFEYKPAGKD